MISLLNRSLNLSTTFGFSYSENKDQPSVDEQLLATKDQVEKYFAFTKDNNPNVVDKFKDLFNKEIINGQNSDE